MLPGSKAWIISGIVFVPSKHCLFQIRGKNRKKSSFKKWNNCFPISVLFLLLMWTHSHLFTWKVTCAWPSSCCSVLISLLSAAKGMGWQQYSRVRQLDWSQLFGSGIAEVGSFYCPFLYLPWWFLIRCFHKATAVCGTSCGSGVFDPRDALAWSPGSHTWCPLAGVAGPWGDRTRCWENKSPCPVLGFWQKVNLFPTCSPCFMLSSQIDFFGVPWTVQAYLHGLWVGCRGNAGSCRGKVQE